MAFLIYIGASLLLMAAAAKSGVAAELDNSTWLIVAILAAAEAIRIEIK